MLHRPSLLLSLLPLVLAPALAAQGRFAAGDVLVRPRPGHAADVGAAVQAAGLEVAETDAISGVLRVSVPAGSEQRWVEELGALAAVDYAERNGLGGGGLVPNDTFFGEQWHLRNTGQSGGTPGADVRATAAWDVTTGSPGTVIAVLDTGIDSDHPDFLGRIAPGGFDFVNQDPDPEADHPHGSWVSGAMCANADNNFGVAGVDWQCMVLPVKVLNANNGGTVMDLAQALNYCATLPQVQVVSMSLINYPGTQTLVNALQTAANAGKILISCAGNGGIGNADVSFPGASPLTISIGATTRTDFRAGFSGTGAALDFVAPGEDITTVAHGTSANSRAVVSGCSFATPITAGIVGLAIAQGAALNLPAFTQTEIYALLEAGARDQVGPPGEDTPGRDNYFGHGRLDARDVVDAVSNLVNCNNGTIGVGLGGPYDVVLVEGRSKTGAARTVTVPANVPFAISVEVPPSNPQPGPVPPFFLLWGVLGDQASMTPTQLPLNLGELCFDPAAPATFVQIAGVAPYTTTVPALPANFVASLQGAMLDSPQATIGITNLVTWDTQVAPPPVIASLTPTAPAPGVTIAINGTGFLPGAELRIAGALTPTLAVTSTQITFTSPAAVPCSTALSVTNPDSQAAQTPFNNPPAITSVVAAQGTPAAGGTQIVLVGSGFGAGSTVTIGGNAMTTTLITPNAIVGTLPPGQVGPATIVVTSPYGCTGNGSLTYTP
ncbi:MAG: S8 family serine peptidase [Planctomycetes bacterium]|nr:S8 family serine peptidase [Planctomycetota bacterium]